jgi:hypothetical protein
MGASVLQMSTPRQTWPVARCALEHCPARACGLHGLMMMNRLSTQGHDRHSRGLESSTTALTMVDGPEIDWRQRALAHRLELSKERLVADLGKLSSLLGTSAGEVSKRFVRATLVVSGLLLLGLVTMAMRRRRRFRVRFL